VAVELLVNPVLASEVSPAVCMSLASGKEWV